MSAFPLGLRCNQLKKNPNKKIKSKQKNKSKFLQKTGSLLRPAGTRGGLAAVPAAPHPQDITVLVTSCTLGLRRPQSLSFGPKTWGMQREN